MNIRFLPHALEQLVERSLDESLVRQVLENPEQTVQEGFRKTAQRRYVDSRSGKDYLLRVVYEQRGQEMCVITVYKTSKVSKYWRP